MGQYYKAIILNEEKSKPLFYGCAHDFGNGVKLMEHSWQGNVFVGLIEKALISNPMRLVWSGDYADNENVENIDKDVLKELAKEYESDEVLTDGANLYSIANHVGVKITHDEHLGYGDNKKSVYDHEFKSLPKRFKYLVNHDTKQFVDKSKVPVTDWCKWQIHPLPLLTCEGNNRGGGDYRGEDKIIGSWARNLISVESRKSNIPKGFTELAFNLVE